MKQFGTNSFARLARTQQSGITIIEVLTSILVAVIGVFGVMVMIPFGVSQAEHGLRQEEASALALNAVSDFKIRNFADSSRWRMVTGAGLASLDQMARAYMIDPIGVADRMANGDDGGVFPFAPGLEGMLGGAPSSANILMNRVSIDATGAGPPMSRAVADQLFSWSSDLVREQVDNDNISPPQQVFDRDAADNVLRRQARRDMSYAIVAVPAKFAPRSPQADQILAWRNYFVVYEKRPQPLQFVGVSEHPHDRVYRVQNPGERVGYSGGDLVLEELGQVSSQTDEIQRGDWMMLTNVMPSPTLGRFVQQVHFYKVVDSTNETGNWEVTLQGPNFDFGGTTDPGSPTATTSSPSETYAVHLPNVWAVFERTFR